jgi:hypothetical protein
VTAGLRVLHVVGEIQNTDAQRNAQNIMVDCKLSLQGVVLSGPNTENKEQTEVDVLQPGEKSPFDVLFFNPPTADAAA